MGYNQPVPKIFAPKSVSPSRCVCATALVTLSALLNVPRSSNGNGFLEISNRYFWDPIATNYFIPCGVAYQIWNPPVGANQSLNQVDYDLLEFKKMHANSVRVEMTWSQVQISPDQYDWSKTDHLVKKSEELGLKLFVIIGYQYPPPWLPSNWRGINNLGLRSDVTQCLSNSTPADALGCLPPSLARTLQLTNSSS